VILTGRDTRESGVWVERAVVEGATAAVALQIGGCYHHAVHSLVRATFHDRRRGDNTRRFAEPTGGCCSLDHGALHPDTRLPGVSAR